MADYTDLNSVRKVLPATVLIDDSTSTPSASTVTSWITLATNQVNVAASIGGVVLPVTDVNLLGAFNIAVAREVAYQVLASRGVVEDSDHKPIWKSWHDDFVKFLELLRKGDLVEISSTESGEPWSTGMDSVDGDDYDARIKRSKVF